MTELYLPCEREVRRARWFLLVLAVAALLGVCVVAGAHRDSSSESTGSPACRLIDGDAVCHVTEPTHDEGKP